MRTHWLTALFASLSAGHDAVLVSVARTEGSVPREAGATMIVTADGCTDTVGGGHLEWQAIAHARRTLAGGTAPVDVQRYNLGARLGQCCGGVVWLLFERIPAHTREAWQARLERVGAGQGLTRRVSATDTASQWLPDTTTANHAELVGGPQSWAFNQHIAAEPFSVYLFGAGHVARALARQLRLLDAAITWIDTRDEAFDGADTAGIHCVVTDLPAIEVAHAPAGTAFVVMTHSHSLDFELCEAIFARRDYAYFGLIGSATKRASFERRLRERGLPAERLDELTCPIGIPGIVGKAPAEIALAVAAELLQVRHTRRLLSHAARPHRIDNPVRLQPE